jgi:hypothetical protein
MTHIGHVAMVTEVCRGRRKGNKLINARHSWLMKWLDVTYLKVHEE